MTGKRAHGRPWVLLAVAVTWAMLGMAIPVLVSWHGVDRPMSVVAAAADAFEVSDPVPMGSTFNLVMQGGRLSLLDGQGHGTTGESQAKLIENGEGTLLVEGPLLSTTLSGRAAATAAPLVSAMTQARFGSMRIRRGTLQLDLGDGRNEQLTEVDLDITNRKRAGFLVRGSVDIRGRRHAVDGQIGPGPERRGGTQSLKLVVKGPLLSGTFDGRIGEGGAGPGRLIGQINLMLPDTARTARAFGLALVENAAKPGLEVKAAIEWSGSTLVLDQLVLASDVSDAQGLVTMSFAGARPMVTGTLAANVLDLSVLAYEPGSWLDDRFNWAVITRTEHAQSVTELLDADIRFSAQKLLFKGLQLDRAAVSTSLRSGKLVADLVEFGYAGGRGDGQLSADFTRGRPLVMWRGRLEGGEAGRLAAAFGAGTWLTGSTTISGELRAEGHRLAQLSSSISGRVKLSMTDGARLGFDLRTLMTTGLRAPVFGWKDLPRGSTSLEELNANISLRSGTWYLDQLAARHGPSVVSVNGSVNTVEQRLDIDIAMSTPRPGATAVGVDNLPVQPNLRIDEIEIRGPVMQPLLRKVTPETRAATPVEGTAPATSALSQQPL